MLENFHFIRPLWLLALIPLLLLAWHVYRGAAGDNPWRRVVDARLLPLLMVGRSQKSPGSVPWLTGLGWTLAVLALANPTWDRKPQPVYQTTAANVVVLDLSRSMLATDLRPSRLVRARYKVEDVLDRSVEGQTGLVVYAGDAFTVAPLTRDVNTIRALVKVLDPTIMPTTGSRADLGLFKAQELLRQAGISSGQVLLIADGVAADNAAAAERAAAQLQRDGYTVSVLGIGAEGSAPLTDAQGVLLHAAAGKLANRTWETAPLQALARAGGGQYRTITDDGAALNALLADRQGARVQSAEQKDATTQSWNEHGPLLALLLLPLAALAFRRNWLVSVAMVAVLASPPQPAMASTWDDLWQRPDQQASKALAAADYARAAELATDAGRRGSAEYKRENFQEALDNFSRAEGTDSDYNRGNALARLGRYQEAITAYDKAIKENAGAEDARVNKAAVEALLKQQAQQKSSDSQKNGAKEDSGQKGGAGQNSSQNQATKDGKGDQTGASSGQGKQQQGQPSAQTNKSDGGKDRPGQSGSSGQVGDGKQDGHDGQTQDPASANGGQPQQPSASGTVEPKPGNQFAQAAKKLADAAGKLADAAKQWVDPDPAQKAQPSPISSGAASGTADNAARASAKPPTGSAEGAQPLDTEERMAAQQWLRRIPDDPGGLLRRKFLYQYRQRSQQADADNL